MNNFQTPVKIYYFSYEKKLIFNPVICEVGVNMMRVVMVTLCGGPSRRQECR